MDLQQNINQNNISDSKPVLSKEAYRGVLGEIPKAYKGKSEAPSETLLTNAAVFLGALLPDSTHAEIVNTMITPNLYVINCGFSGRGRKGTSGGIIEEVTRLVHPDFMKTNFRPSTPVSSAALIGSLANVPGKNGKTILQRDEEFERTIESINKSDSLSAHYRQIYDNKTTVNDALHNYMVAESPRLSISADVTPDVLANSFKGKHVSNGFLNRFMVFWSEREDIVNWTEEAPKLEPIIQELKDRLSFAQGVGKVTFSSEAKEMYIDFRKDTSTEEGPLQDFFVRKAIHVTKLALIFSQYTNGEGIIEGDDFLAAKAIWTYSADTIKHILQPTSGPKAPLQLALLPTSTVKSTTSAVASNQHLQLEDSYVAQEANGHLPDSFLDFAAKFS